MYLRKISDDLFKIRNIAFLQKQLGNASYDFDFRNNFECDSIFTGIDVPVILRIGAINDYSAIVDSLSEIDMGLLVSEEEHLRCSTIEKWYPLVQERTPFTMIYDNLPPIDKLLEHFSFPVFIKGNRQTNLHKKAQSIIVDVDSYKNLQNIWHYDKVLSWQKVAIREYVPLQVVDKDSFPDMVPISYEFRFFYFRNKCMAFGSYWNIGSTYSLTNDELKEILPLTDWVASKLDVNFVAIDVAKTATGEWILIEVNDAQESGYTGVKPLILWNNVINSI